MPSFSLDSDNAIYDFSRKAVENGLDIFRVFDSLNYIGSLRQYLHFYNADRLDRECGSTSYRI
jgi:pyruvate carboxylase